MDSNYLWLRGNHLSDVLQTKLHSIADGPVFEIVNDRDLIPLGGRVPTETLPEVNWAPLRELTSLSLPVAALPQGKVSRIQLSLLRSSVERPADLVLCRFLDFAAWGLAEADVRLQRCRVAVMDDSNAAPDSMCLIWGRPLPAVNGERFWLSGQVAMPVGFDCSPAIDHGTLLSILAKAYDGEISGGDVVLWRHDDGDSADSLCVVPSDDFAAASRQSIRKLQA